MIPFDKIKEMTGEDVPFYSGIEREFRLWYSLYTNAPPWQCKEGKRKIVPIGLPAAIVRELAKPAVIEAVISVEGSKRAAWIQEQINGFCKHLRHDLEKGLALGNMVYRPYFYGENKLGIACHFLDTFFPVAFAPDGSISQAVFLEHTKIEGKWYALLEHHKLEKDRYTIKTKAFLSNETGLLGTEVALHTISNWKEIQEEIVIGGVEKPLFGFFKTPFGNNTDTSSKLGISVYAGAVTELIRQADEQWEKLQWEFTSGERRVFVSPEAVQTTKGGNVPMDRLYTKLGIEEGEDFFHEFSPAYRESNLYNGLQMIYKAIEFGSGLSYGILSDPQTVAMTATEIESSKQRMYATIDDIQQALEDTIRDLIYALDVMATLWGIVPEGTYQVIFDWGDGIIKDTEAQQGEYEHMRNDVAAGLLRPELYLAKKYGVTEEEALQMMPEEVAEV